MFDLDFYSLRILSAFLCGALISISGSLSQHASQNSLAGPSTLGFDGVAVICVIFAQVLKLIFKLEIGVELLGLALFFPMVCVSYAFKKYFTFLKIEKFDIKTIVLIGLCFNLFVGAIFSIIQFLFMSLNFEFPSGLWFGNFRFVSESSLLTLVLSFMGIYFITFKMIKNLRLLSLGKGISQNLKIESGVIQKKALLVSLMTTIVVINLFGVFSFLSLIFPLVLRSFNFFRVNLKREILIGCFINGLFLSVIDFFCYNYSFQGIEFPVGMMSSILGAFILMALLIKQGNQRGNI